jgi:hypothetical protein
MTILILHVNRPVMVFKCLECGELTYNLPIRKWHWLMGGKKCYGEWEEGTAELIFTPKTLTPSSVQKDKVTE